MKNAKYNRIYDDNRSFALLFKRSNSTMKEHRGPLFLMAPFFYFDSNAETAWQAGGK
jgi:hypothetical protein